MERMGTSKVMHCTAFLVSARWRSLSCMSEVSDSRWDDRIDALSVEIISSRVCVSFEGMGGEGEVGVRS